MAEEPAKVRCRTCYNDHDFRRCEIPPSKKDLKKMQLFNEVLAGSGAPAPAATEEAPAPATEEVEAEKPAKKGKKK